MTKRAALLMVLVCFPILTCTPVHRPPMQMPETLIMLDRTIGCPNGIKTKQLPVVCVNRDSLSVTPYEIRAHNHKKGDLRKPVKIYWFTNTGTGNLGIEFSRKGCISKLWCPQEGVCIAETNLKTPPENGEECSYTVNLEGKKVDPTVIIDPCCMDNP